MKKGSTLSKRHAMLEFGTVLGTTQSVRANRLEDRLQPAVPFPHRHAFFHLVAVTGGSGWHEIDFRRYKVGPNALFLMKPGQVHSWVLGKKTKGFVLEFENSALLSSELVGGIADFYELPSLSSPVLTLLETMLESYEREGALFESQLKHYVMALLIEISRLKSTVGLPTPASDPFLDRFLSLVGEHYSREHAVEFYARELRTTAKALTMRTLRALGKSARTLIQDRVVLESKRLLAYSNLSIAEIAYEVGFDDPNYFTRFFKSQTGSVPGAFRKEVK